MSSDRKQNDGGPAYPRTGEGFGNPHYDAPGMSLRDAFAISALPECIDAWAIKGSKVVAEKTYEYADAMLKAREAKQ